MNVSIVKANKQQIGEILDLMLAGVSSDPLSVEEMNRSWWRRLFFRHYLGPRLLGNQMDTFAALRGEEQGRALVGYLVVQYEGETAGTFDWALTEGVNPETVEIVADLLDAALDHVQETTAVPYFYFGLLADSPPLVPSLLQEMGFWLADYQNVQMRAPLPLASSAALPDGVRLRPQISARFGPRLAELVPYDYGLRPEDLAGHDGDATPESPEEAPHSEEEEPLSLADQVAAIVDLHRATLGASKIYLVEEEGQTVGFVQQFRWKAELRLLLALEESWWGSERERQLVAALPAFLGRRSGQVRVRTFSQAHLAASRASLESLGLAWEPAPWQRWIVGL